MKERYLIQKYFDDGEISLEFLLSYYKKFYSDKKNRTTDSIFENLLYEIKSD